MKHRGAAPITASTVCHPFEKGSKGFPIFPGGEGRGVKKKADLEKFFPCKLFEFEQGLKAR